MRNNSTLSREGKCTNVWLKILNSYIYHYACSTDETFLRADTSELRNSLGRNASLLLVVVIGS